MSDDSDQELLDIKRKRLQELQRKAAIYGIDTPPHISIEIGMLQKDITQLENKKSAKCRF